MALLGPGYRPRRHGLRPAATCRTIHAGRVAFIASAMLAVQVASSLMHSPTINSRNAW